MLRQGLKEGLGLKEGFGFEFELQELSLARIMRIIEFLLKIILVVLTTKILFKQK